MTDEELKSYISLLQSRYDIIKARGKCLENQGVLRRLARRINKAKQGVIIS